MIIDTFSDNSANVGYETIEYIHNYQIVSVSDYVNVFNRYCKLNYYTVGRQFTFDDGILADILSENYKLSNSAIYNLTEIAEVEVIIPSKNSFSLTHNSYYEILINIPSDYTITQHFLWY